MAYQANREYEVAVVTANLMSSRGGTPGLELYFVHPEHGEIKDVLWLTDKARPRAEKTLKEVFNIAPERLSSPTFYENADTYLQNLRCWIVTELDTYDGKERIRVKRINSRPGGEGGESNISKADLARKAAAFMGGPTAPKSKESKKAAAPITDDDVPF